MVKKSYSGAHMARKIYYELLHIEKRQNQNSIILKVMENNLEITQNKKNTE